MTELKNPSQPLLETIRSKSVISGLFAGFLLSGGLSAQHSAGHTVFIRIVRPIQFSVETAEDGFRNSGNSDAKNDGMWLAWKSDSKAKKVTVSRTGKYSEGIFDLPMPDGNSQARQNRMRLMALGKNAAAGMPQRDPGGPSGAKQAGVPQGDMSDRLYFTVMDI
jgi:hypothetical protein